MNSIHLNRRGLSSERRFDMRHYSQLSRGMIITAALVFSILASQASTLADPITNDDASLIDRFTDYLTKRANGFLGGIQADLVADINHAIRFDDDWQLLEAQLLALELSYGALQPPADLTEQIMNDLAAIREAYPDETRVIKVPANQFLPIDSEGNLILPDDPWQYEEVVTHIRNGLSNPYMSGGSGGGIEVGPPFYTFSTGWGDCMNGCINKQEWHYRVDDGHVTVIPEPATLSLLGIGGLAMIRRRRKHHTLQ